MSPSQPVEFVFRDLVTGHCESWVMPRSMAESHADSLLGLGWPEFECAILPLPERESMANALMIAFWAWLVKQAVPTARAHWEILIVALLYAAFAVAVLFAPAVERPALIAGPVVSLGLGVLIGRKYFSAKA